MKFCIITHVLHKKQGNQYVGYGPYVREMNLWLRENDQLIIVAPIENTAITAIDLPYSHKNIHFIPIPNFNLTSTIEIFKTVFLLPFVIFNIFRGMFIADHIHLRCPGNIGLLACMVQIFFPSKKKTAKYAGNWDPKSVQPLTYKLQRWILSNTLITKNMQTLVYGDWENQTKNIKPFFTASYWSNDIVTMREKDICGKLKLIYVGSLIPSKNPILSIEMAKALIDSGRVIELNFYGEGTERKRLEDYIVENNLSDSVYIHGNVNSKTLIAAYQEAHFLIFISKSEGWPKVVAESMFWGCVPITTAVSCVPWMLDQGNRGYLVQEDENMIVEIISKISQDEYNEKSQNASTWSREFTLDKFELEVKRLIK